MGITCYNNRNNKKGINVPENNKEVKNKYSNIENGNKGEGKGDTRTMESTNDVQKKKDDEININIIKNRNEIKKKEELLIKKSYSNLDTKNDYFIICPKCEKFSPIIKKLDYDSDKNDFKITYICNCNIVKSKSEECYLIDLISGKKPSNQDMLNISKISLDKINQKIIEKQESFKGFLIVDKIIKNLYSSSVGNKNIFNGKKSVYHLEISQNLNQRDSYLFDQFKSKINTSLAPRNKFKRFQLIKTLKKHTDIISSIIQITSGNIVSGSYDSKIYIWDIREKEPIKDIQEEGSILCLLELKPNCLLAGNNKNKINLWDLEKNEKIYVYSGHYLEVNCLIMCDNNYFASSSKDKTIKIWDYNKREEERAIPSDNSAILCLIKLNNQNLCSGNDDKCIKIWDWRNGNLIQSIEGHEGMVTSICKLDNVTILSGDDNKKIIIWINYNMAATIHDSHDEQVQSLCKIDDNFFASGSFDDTISIWDKDQLERQQLLEGHLDKISCLLKLRNNNLVSSSYDKTIKIWTQE